MSAGLLDDAVHGCKTESRSFSPLFGGKERFEEFLLEFERNSDAGVGDREFDETVIDLVVAGGENERSAVGHGIAGVDAKIENDLDNLVGVSLDRPEIRSEIALQLNIFRDEAADHAAGFREDDVAVKNLRRQHLLAAESKQLAGQRRGALRCAQNLIDVMSREGIAVRQAGCEAQIGVAEDHHEHVVEVVGHAAGQTADGIHLLRLLQLLLQLGFKGNVTLDGNVVDDLAGGG